MNLIIVVIVVIVVILISIPVVLYLQTRSPASVCQPGYIQYGTNQCCSETGGRVEGDKCKCNSRWIGANCDLSAGCPNGFNVYGNGKCCSNQGGQIVNGQCVCKDEWEGEECTIMKPITSCPSGYSMYTAADKTKKCCSDLGGTVIKNIQGRDDEVCLCGPVTKFGGEQCDSICSPECTGDSTCLGNNICS